MNGLQVLSTAENDFQNAQAPKVQARLTVFSAPPETATGAAILVCPGGGYGHLAIGHEGQEIAAWLNARGVAAFLLEYRIAPDVAASATMLHPAPLRDAQNAMRYIRAHAAQWQLDLQRIGVWGFSAGGHLASTLATQWHEAICRPDFAILAYPVITLQGEWAHAGSRRNLLGAESAPELVQSLCNETRVTPQTPPTFLLHTNEDAGVPAENSALFYLALRRAGVAAELHIYERGPHGVGLAGADDVLCQWPLQLENWLRHRDVVR